MTFMADLIQMTTPIVPKNYTHAIKQPSVQNDQIFELADMTKIIKTNDRSEQYRQENSDFAENSNLLNIAESIAKNPKSASEILKSVMSSETMSLIKSEGNEELLNKVTEFASEIVRTPDSAAGDLEAQQKESTLFNGKFWDAVRNMVAGNPSEELKNAVFSLLKATSGAVSQRDVLNSLAANLKFMAEELAPNKQLSQSLMNLASDFAANGAEKNFSELKNAAMNALAAASKSLLISDKIKDIMPIVVHNLSRFSGDAESLSDAFANFKGLISDEAIKQQLTEMFAEFAEGSAMPASIKAELLGSKAVMGESTIASALAKLSADAAIHTSDIDVDAFRQAMSNITGEGSDGIREVLKNLLPSSDNASAEKILANFGENKDINLLASRLQTVLSNIDNENVKMSAVQKLNDLLGKMVADGSVKYEPPSSMDVFTDFISKNINNPMLKYLSGLDKGVLAQNMLTTPGAEIPLMHFLMPMEEKGVRAFGELWADNGAAGTVTDKAQSIGSHLFLTFDIEGTGSFEMEIYAKDDYLDVSLLCPSGTENVFSSMKTAVPRIASQCGYQVKKMTLGQLRERRDLDKVFPALRNRRTGINVKV